jgi:predicted aspartyl protease
MALPVSTASAEYYSYEDRNGTIHFVDSLSSVPKDYRKRVQVRKDADDDLSPDERVRLQDKEKVKRAEDRRRTAEQEEQDRKRRAEEVRKALEERLTTKVYIVNRQVFVPVRLRNGTAEAEVLLQLDTGASSTVITPDLAERLKIMDADNVKVGVVGGRFINAKKALLTEMEVGPIRKTNQEVVIVRQHPSQEGAGLLGMSFLGGLKYTIDLETQTIRWHP